MKKDIEKAVSVISPYIPLVGILGGIATTGKHIYKHKTTAGKKDIITDKEA